MWSGSFTKNAQAALTLAEKTAARLHTGYVGTEHILVGLLKEESGVAAKILEDNGADADKILEMIRELINDTLDLCISSDDRIKLSLRSKRSQIPAVLLQS